MDISKESEATKPLYGVGGKDTDKSARACLLARKLSEAGVRLVQVTMGGWDHHGDKMHVRDLHATLLHRLGIDLTKLQHRHLGRDYRLTDVYGEVVKEIIA